ncbi:hypothetical protein HK099_006016 [Clydaea vesicula]|uniref:NADH-ubiquinone oxidoreductase chain 2 n=1 Tax=Clydaea vesicula TaxID=447962 RepID=A0AAD5TYD9_9FUNG|nr:hypothetical protein HK099_006016 [Clydaea vesicula]
MFKLSAAPFHQWAPDLYDSLPTPIAMYLIGYSCKGDSGDISFMVPGIFKMNPYLVAALAIILFSLAGIPPLAGFFAKLQVIHSIVNDYHIMISLIVILASVISTTCYLLLIKGIFSVISIEFLYSFGVSISLMSTPPNQTIITEEPKTPPRHRQPDMPWLSDVKPTRVVYPELPAPEPNQPEPVFLNIGKDQTVSTPDLTIQNFLTNRPNLTVQTNFEVNPRLNRYIDLPITPSTPSTDGGSDITLVNELGTPSLPPTPNSITSSNHSTLTNESDLIPNAFLPTEEIRNAVMNFSIRGANSPLVSRQLYALPPIPPRDGS